MSSDFNKKVTLIQVDIDNDAAIADVDKLTNALLAEQSALKKNNDEIKALEKSQKEINKEQEKGLITSKEASKLRKQNVNQVETLKKSNLNLKDGIKDINRARTQAVKVSKLQANSLDALRAKTISQKKELNGLNTETVEGAKRFEQLTKELEKNNDAIVDADQSAGDFKTTVGRYKEEMQGAIAGTGKFGSTITGVFDTLKANPIILLVSILASLFAAFTKTSKGAKFMAQASAFLGGIMSELIGIVDNVASFLTSAFEDPQQAIKDLGDFLIDNIVNRFKAIIDLGLALGSVLKSLFEGDLEGVKIAAQEAGTALIQMGTGLDSEQQKKFADGLSNIANEALKTANAFAELAGRQIDVANANRKAELSAAKLGAEEERLIAIREDDTRSFEEREAAGIKVFELSKQRAEEEVKIAKRNQSLLNAEIALRKSNGEAIQGLLDEKLAADIAVVESEKELVLKNLENQEKQSLLLRDIWEQDLDFAIDVGTRKTEAQLKFAEDETLSIEQRQEALEKARALDEEAFNNQLILFEEVGLSREKINQLTNESNAAVINSELKKTELNEIERNRFKELVLERQGLNEGLKETEKSLEEAVKNRVAVQIEQQKTLNAKLLELGDFKREQANEIALGELDDDAARFQLKLEQEDERHSILLNRLEERKEEDLENLALTEEERGIVEAEFQIEKEELLAENLSNEKAIRDEADSVELEDLKKKQDTKKAILNEALNAAQGAIGLAFDIAADRRAKEFGNESTQLELKFQDEQAQLRQNLDNGLITQEQFDAQSVELEKKFALDQHAIAVAEFKANKKASLGEIAIQTAIAIAKALASGPPPANLIAAGVVGGAALLQTAAVLSASPPTAPQFADGGDVFGSIVGGKSHSQGGTRYKGADGNEFEVEKGEGIFVTKREATNPALALLSGVNEKFGGASMFGNSSRFLQQGGQAGGLGSTEISRLANEIVQGLPTPVVEVQSVMAGINADIDAKSVGIK